MILIDEILISEDLVKEQFVCDLNACKGACCIEGDYGAPLSEEEVDTIENILPVLKPYLSEAALQKINQEGPSTFSNMNDCHETQLMDNGACVFMGTNALGINYCSIEKAFNDGKTDFKKPVSCHLYPIRVHKNKSTGFEALNYDRWDICSAACTKGNKLSVRVFEFAKEALIRKYGEEFYAQLEAAADHMER
mgnify:CR=1 FL=1|jgi:hypothetical protein